MKGHFSKRLSLFGRAEPSDMIILGHFFFKNIFFWTNKTQKGPSAQRLVLVVVMELNARMGAAPGHRVTPWIPQVSGLNGTTRHIHKRFGDMFNLSESNLGFVWFHPTFPPSQQLWLMLFLPGSPFLQRQPNKAFPVPQGDAVHAWSAVQRLCCSSDHDDHGVASPVTRQQVVNGIPVHWANTWKRKKRWYL